MKKAMMMLLSRFFYLKLVFNYDFVKNIEEESNEDEYENKATEKITVFFFSF